MRLPDLPGHYSYCGITGNSVAITRFRHEVRSGWRKWLNRRRGRPSPSTPATVGQRTHEAVKPSRGERIG
ncbi:MAG: hypothetical protein E6J59_12110 [Deltaproteobacteria bacterium]|nr:MAG: hypothetical protein E6J59_12110 [Deltaproteobacteria bacterium]